MNESERLADQIERALNGEAWHGPSWRELLENVGREAALRKALPEAHSIAEIVLHAGTWHDAARRRLLGEIVDVSAAEDWPAAAMETERAWSDAMARLFDTGRALRETVAAFPVERLHEARPNTSDTWYGLMLGILQHDLYHAGQVALLRKAAVPVTA